MMKTNTVLMAEFIMSVPQCQIVTTMEKTTTLGMIGSLTMAAMYVAALSVESHVLKKCVQVS